MTKDEYRKILEIMSERHKKEVFELQKEFALSNSTVKVGNVISDGDIRIKVDRISISLFVSELPVCVYSGVLLTKAGIPYKTGEIRRIDQRNVKSC